MTSTDDLIRSAQEQHTIADRMEKAAWLAGGQPDFDRLELARSIKDRCLEQLADLAALKAAEFGEILKGNVDIYCEHASLGRAA